MTQRIATANFMNRPCVSTSISYAAPNGVHYALSREITYAWCTQTGVRQ